MSYDFEALLADPGTEWAGPRREREAFRRWAGDRFDSWYRRGHALAEAKDNSSDGGYEEGSEVEFFESCWHPDGPEAYSRLKDAERQSKVFHEVWVNAFWEGVNAATDEAVDAGIVTDAQVDTIMEAVKTDRRLTRREARTQ